MAQHSSQIDLDQIYTPIPIALRMLDAAGDLSPSVIADFAAGEGALLATSMAKWPGARFVALDICRSTVKQLSTHFPKWGTAQCDFLSSSSRARTKVLSSLGKQCSLILLNPPFSCRGGARLKVSFRGKEISCSPAMAFVLLSIQFLSREGLVVCLLPDGCIASEKDSSAWAALSEVATWTVVESNGKRAFSGHVTQTAIVRVQLTAAYRKSAASPPKRSNTAGRKLRARLVRGCVPIHTTSTQSGRGKLPVIHSTELQDGVAKPNGRKGVCLGRVITRPSVLIPRVGMPASSKICLYSQNHSVILSDCVIGLQCESMNSAKQLKARLVGEWQKLRGEYRGTGAPYLTIGRFRRVLSDLGVVVADQ